MLFARIKCCSDFAVLLSVLFYSACIVDVRTHAYAVYLTKTNQFELK